MMVHVHMPVFDVVLRQGVKRNEKYEKIQTVAVVRGQTTGNGFYNGENHKKAIRCLV